MNYRVLLIAVGMLASFSPMSVLMASDLEREKRLADQFIETLFDGEAIWLEANNRQFASIYTEAEESERAVIVLHGRGFHPDWEDTVQPLRVGLLDYGWNSLAIQMPVLEKQAKYYDYRPLFPESWPRIQAAIDYLKQEGNTKIVVIAHSCSVHMSMPFVAKDNGSQISAFVGLGMGATDYKQPMAEPFPLQQIKIPVLDLYGEEDFPAVHRLSERRLNMIQQAGNEHSKQMVLPEANHYFTDKGDELVEVVGGWLDTVFVTQ